MTDRPKQDRPTARIDPEETLRRMQEQAVARLKGHIRGALDEVEAAAGAGVVAAAAGAGAPVAAFVGDTRRFLEDLLDSAVAGQGRGPKGGPSGQA